LSGEIIAFNDALEDTPELVNDDPYGEGWIVKIKLNNLSEIEDLLSDEGYQAVIS
jgi:glycine cleavage system H protein